MKSLLLLIETADKVCSVALAQNGQIISVKTETNQNKSLEIINLLIDQLFTDTGFSIKALNGVAISAGPGSYTGLRVGASCAKGICYALSIPLIQVDTLSAMIVGVKSRYQQSDYDTYIPMIDARRTEVFCRVEARDKTLILETGHQFLDQTFMESIKNNKKTIFFGSGASKVKIENPLIDFVFDGFELSADDLAPMAFLKYQEQAFESVAYFEPKYMKEVYISSRNPN